MLACYDEKISKYVALCKIGTGFSDEFMVESTKRHQIKIVNEKP